MYIQRRFDQPQTPFERLCAANALTPERRAELEQLWQQTNPRCLREEIYKLLEELFALPNATLGVTENVLDTLMASTST